MYHSRITLSKNVIFVLKKNLFFFSNQIMHFFILHFYPQNKLKQHTIVDPLYFLFLKKWINKLGFEFVVWNIYSINIALRPKKYKKKNVSWFTYSSHDKCIRRRRELVAAGGRSFPIVLTYESNFDGALLEHGFMSGWFMSDCKCYWMSCP